MAPIVLRVGGVPKQSKMAIEAEIENNFVYYLNSKCCRVPLIRSVPLRSTLIQFCYLKSLVLLTDRIGRHEVLIPIYYKNKNFRKKNK